MLAEMRRAGEGFFRFAMRMSQQHRQYFQSLILPPSVAEEFERLAVESLQQQEALELANDEPFDHYLQRYFAQKV